MFGSGSHDLTACTVLDGSAARALAVAWEAFAARSPEGAAAPERHEVVVNPDGRGGFRIRFVALSKTGTPHRRGRDVQGGSSETVYAIDAQGELTGPLRAR